MHACTCTKLITQVGLHTHLHAPTLTLCAHTHTHLGHTTHACSQTQARILAHTPVFICAGTHEHMLTTYLQSHAHTHFYSWLLFLQFFPNPTQPSPALQPPTILPHDQDIPALVLRGQEDLGDHYQDLALGRRVDVPDTFHAGWVVPWVVGGLDIAGELTQLPTTLAICRGGERREEERRERQKKQKRQTDRY